MTAIHPLFSTVAVTVVLSIGLVATNATAQPPPPTPGPIAQPPAPPTATTPPAPQPVAPSPPPPYAPPPPQWYGPMYPPPRYAPPIEREPEPEPAERKPNPTAFRVDFKLPASIVSIASASNSSVLTTTPPVPQLSLGVRNGRVGFLVGIGFARVASSQTGSSQTFSSTQVLLAPTLTYDVFESNDRKVALYLLGAPIFGAIVGGGNGGFVNSDLGFQFALGAKVALHDNFQIGLEAGPVGQFYSPQDNGENSISIVSIYGALVGSFIGPT